MRCSALSLMQAAGLALAVLAGGSVWAQGIGYTGGYRYGSPYPGAAYPYWGSAPSSMGASTYSGIPSPYWDTTPGMRWAGYPHGGGYVPDVGRPYYGSVGAGYTGGYPSPFLASDLSLLPGVNYTPARDNSAHIRLRVPADAEVWFDGEPTKQKGTLRQYTSPPLPQGKQFVYALRVRWTKDGRQVEENRRIPVHANDWLNLDFPRPSTDSHPGSSGTAKPQR